ncbi:transposable element Tcb1 transposase [Trichonephila clavipes]|nr:transposable element Tcb1 transposase [Trichonephila clavipes]
MLEKVIENWTSRLDYIRASRGSHMPEIIFKIVCVYHSTPCLKQSDLSARRPLLGLPLTQNHRRLRRQWCDERRMWVAEWNEVVFTDKYRIFFLKHNDGRIRVWRHREEKMLNSCVMHRHIGPAPGLCQRYISEVLVPVVLPYIHGLATAIFQQDNVRLHVARIVQTFFVNQQIELISLADSLSRSFADRKHVVHDCSTIDPDYTPSCHTR